jgi:N-acetylglutamate synthase-like GNAT family acetyltransferase
MAGAPGADGKGEQMNVRPATQDDVPRIVKLIGEVWAEYGCILNTDIEEQYLLTPAEYFHSKNGEFWVVETDGKIVATCAVQMHDQNIAELKSLYVHKDARKRGLGCQLTEMTMDFARDRGATEMILWSDTRFEAAHRLYERLGFAKTGERKLDDINNTTEFGFGKRM